MKFLLTLFLFPFLLSASEKTQVVGSPSPTNNDLQSTLKTTASSKSSLNSLQSGLEESARDHMLEELGVNNITTPLVGKVFHDLELFQPPPLEEIKAFDNNAMFTTRLQTALQFGALVANGFVATIARQQALILQIGQALIKDANALAAGEKLVYHSKSLFELSDRGDWQGLREELDRCQKEVEDSMIELHDGEMADLVSLGGWLRGFQLAAHVTANYYTQDKAKALVRLPIIDYFIERMDTLNPKVKQRPLVVKLTANLKTIRGIAAQNEVPTVSDVKELERLAAEALREGLSHEVEKKP